MAEQHRKRTLDSGWLAARSTEVQFTGTQLTTTHPPTGPTSPWMEALVPATVLATLVKNKVVPDPFYGLQNEHIIDIADSGRDYYTFWFFTTLNCKLSNNEHCDLNFRGINYSADVYLNGHQIVLPKGMFRRHSIHVTDFVHADGTNLLAVLVHPPDHPGRIPPKGGQGGDHEIGKDVATQYVEGWDWMAPIRDRNTGIWDEVSISVTGPVKIIYPHLVSTFSDDYKKAYLHTTIELQNRSSWTAQCSLSVQVTIEPEDSIILVEHLQSQNLSIPANSRVQYTFPEDLVNLIHGAITLDSAKLRAISMMLLVEDMNFNMIRCWGGGLAERPEFYYYCDYYGLLVWQEFWITGDVDGRGDPVSNPDGPLDHDLFLFCARDTVKLLRNHPSLALWVGGNEQIPPADINAALKYDLRLHPYFESKDESSKPVGDLSPTPSDPSQYLDGTRIYIQGSMWDGFADGMGNFTDGPYEIQNPEDFFKDDYYKYGFNPEVGSVGMPVAATIRATMPPEGWKIPLFKKLPNGYVEEVPNAIWEYHKYIPYSKPNKVHDQIQLYGDAKDLDDFCLKAQLVNYIQYRALLEGWTSHMWSKYTGVLIWKTQNPWTGLRGQFYDHLLDQTAGFYGCRCAAEPIHVQLNLATYLIEVVNTTSKELSNVAIETSVWDLEGTRPYYSLNENLSFLPKKVAPIIEMEYPKSKDPKPVYFLLLKLYNMSDKSVISRNFYWLHLSGGDYKLLEPYREKKIPLKITSKVSIEESVYNIQMHVTNSSERPESRSSTVRPSDGFCGTQSLETPHFSVGREHETVLLKGIHGCFSGKSDGLKVTEIKGSDVGVAFFLQISVHTSKKNSKEGEEDTRILPVHYSDNYFSLVPGETMPINISFEAPQGVTPQVLLHGWNYNGGELIYEVV
ncbi:mannosylglycoprotein endo-beta-mannosidase isoform X2 [Vigna angularis]|uniref:mannosylglycoprotein endo-beta-mannosidase isoform X2 n=1 Tax=Phaseolus angularis TaxID=3914 RepID=UPI0022B448A1|nr:mannosylglycoprotein endo-beta-mannosidase isoform X2 [Vigna angularis]